MNNDNSSWDLRFEALGGGSGGASAILTSTPTEVTLDFSTPNEITNVALILGSVGSLLQYRQSNNVSDFNFVQVDKDAVFGGSAGVPFDDPFIFPAVAAVPEPASINIKPRSCPNPLNVKSKGLLPVAILGAADFDVADVDLASVRLEGVAPLRSNVEDVAAPFSFPAKEFCNDCTTDGPDGFMDLTVKFDTQELVAALGNVSDRDCLILQLTGTLQDGTAIAGEDVVLILKK